MSGESGTRSGHQLARPAMQIQEGDCYKLSSRFVKTLAPGPSSLRRHTRTLISGHGGTNQKKKITYFRNVKKSRQSRTCSRLPAPYASPRLSQKASSGAVGDTYSTVSEWDSPLIGIFFRWIWKERSGTIRFLHGLDPENVLDVALLQT